MRAAGAIAIAVSALALAAGQQQQQQQPENPPLPPEIQAVYGLAMSAPPEFAADALLRIAALDRSSLRPAWKREIIQKALSFAVRAQNPYEKVSLPGTGTDTRSGFVANALQLRLDVISLQARAIIGLLAFDKKAALADFAQMQHPVIDTLKCEDALVPDLSGYYVVLDQVVRQAVEKPDDKVRFLLTAIANMSSVVDVSPLARVLLQAQLGAAEQQALYDAFATKLGALPVDGRAFGFYENPIRTDLEGMSARPRVKAAVDKFLERQRSGSKCFTPSPLTADGQAPENVPNGPKTERYWQSEAAKRVFETAVFLQFTPNGALIEEAERATPEWGRKLADLLSTLDGWTASEETSEADYYHQKAVVYEGLVELTPAGPMQDKLLGAYVSFLTNSNLQQEAPVEWFWHARSLLDRMKPVKGGAEKVLAAFTNSGSNILALEAALETAAPLPFVR